MPRQPPEPPPTLADYSAREPRTGRVTGGRRLDSARPRVSIVTIVRNAARNIERTLQCVQSQRGTSIEHVVIDGASHDGTLDIIRRHDERIAAWVSEPDDGISDAFNKGIALTRGEIVGMLNADDVYEPDAIADSVAALDANPDAGFTFGDCAYTAPGRRDYFRKSNPDYVRTIGRRMPDCFHHPTMFVRKSVYERFGLFRSRYRIGMDYDFLLRIHHGGVRGIQVPKVLARMSLGGVSNTRMVAACREWMEIAIDNGEPAGPAVAQFAALAAEISAKEAVLKLGGEPLKRWIERRRRPA